MDKAEELKKVVMDKYSIIAKENSGCGCGCGPNKETEFSVFNEDYSKLPGYEKDADLSLGCGLPTEHAGINEGEDVLDLGSGAGNDCFVVRSIVGDQGSVTGLDFTDDMIRKAIANNLKLGYKNVDFIKGDIESLPLENENFDIVISNCVLNLVPDKVKAFNEIARVLRPEGHFCVSDIVLKGDLPDKLRDAAALYAGCVSGALQKEEYLKIIKETGFNNIEVKKERQIEVPESLLLPYISKSELDDYRKTGAGIYSITVVGYK